MNTEVALQVSTQEVDKLIRSFPAGSSGGPDGIRPQHILDLVNCKETGTELLMAITSFVNLLLEGRCHSSVIPILFGGKLLALEKKSGGIRPIAVGYYWRRLASKCANNYAVSKLESSFKPRQVGVGVPGGCEAAVHATRRFVASMQPGQVVAKLDFTNAFNCLRRDSMLDAVVVMVPEIFPFCHMAYSSHSILQFGYNSVYSEEGAQQGDPLGPLLFCLTLQPILCSLSSRLSIGFLDDITIGDDESVVACDVEKIQSSAAEIGLELNLKKCEVIHSESTSISLPIFREFIHVKPEHTTLLGAPLFSGPAMDEILSQKCNDLRRAADRLELISSHDALLILRSSLSAPRLLHVIRSSPCSGNQFLSTFDCILRNSLSVITNINISDIQWIQASLPVRDGGLGVRSVVTLAPSAFLASAAGSRELQDCILERCDASVDTSFDANLQCYISSNISPPPSGTDAHKQRCWDKTAIQHAKDFLTTQLTDQHNRARLLATSAPHSSDWLHALPITACGLRLDNEAIRVAVGLRLGANICEPHPCPCGSEVSSLGHHGLSCKRSAGRISRHQIINDLIHRALIRADIPSVKEPVGLARSDGKRPDGLTLIPWKAGRHLTWDVTVSDTLAASYLHATSARSAAAAELASERKQEKYSNLLTLYEFYPIAMETLGPMNESGRGFLEELGRRISAKSGDLRETSFLFQRISVAIQRSNAICFRGSFPHNTED